MMGGMFTVRHHHVDRPDGEADNWWEIRWHPPLGPRWCVKHSEGWCARETHHLDDDGRHWCPTGFMYCHEHAGTGTIEGPGQCDLWGKLP